MPNYFGDHRLRRDDFIKPKEAISVSKKDSEYLVHYGHCQYSGRKLLKPIVVSRMGKLYNKMMVIEYLLGTTSQTVNNLELKPPTEIKSTKDFWQVSHISDNPKFKQKIKTKEEKEEERSRGNGSSSANADERSNFPFICETSGQEMNGQYKFVFGLESKAIVSEQALRECNAKLFPKGKGTISNEVVSGTLHPCYDQTREKLLICPVTNKPFGRPIQLYPSSPAEIKRAEEFKFKKSKKRKDCEKSSKEDQLAKAAVGSKKLKK